MLFLFLLEGFNPRWSPLTSNHCFAQAEPYLSKYSNKVTMKLTVSVIMRMMMTLSMLEEFSPYCWGAFTSNHLPKQNLPLKFR